MSVSKVKANYIHFKRRLFERYGVNISKTEYDTISDAIKSGEYVDYFMRSDTKRRKIYRLPIKGVIVNVIYSCKQHNLVTALPKWLASE
jgi:hypothetical protein